MSHFPTKPKKKSRIEIIPMIDVMMFLMVFFVLISINVIPSMGIKTRQPQSSQAQNLSNPEKPVVITLAKDDQIQVDGQNTSLEELVKTILKSSSKKDNLSIIINSDEAARVQRLVDVMDEIKKSDIGKVTLAAKSKP
jgi:biopolymer transport protein ExbD